LPDVVEQRIEDAIDRVFRQPERPTVEKLRRDTKDGDILAPPGDWAPMLLRNRYIRLWIYRHRHWPVDQLIATLVEAVDVALDRNRDIVLPEWPAEPAAGQAGDPPLEASSA
jgi:hypothetical protein